MTGLPGRARSDPAHSDDEIDRLTAAATSAARPAFRVTAGAEGAAFELG